MELFQGLSVWWCFTFFCGKIWSMVCVSWLVRKTAKLSTVRLGLSSLNCAALCGTVWQYVAFCAAFCGTWYVFLRGLWNLRNFRGVASRAYSRGHFRGVMGKNFKFLRGLTQKQFLKGCETSYLIHRGGGCILNGMALSLKRFFELFVGSQIGL